MNSAAQDSELPAGPPAPTASEPGSPPSHSQQQHGLLEDLGVDKPVQVCLKQCTGQDEEKVTLSQLVAKEYMVFSAMPAVMTAFKHALTFGASTAMCHYPR